MIATSCVVILITIGRYTSPTNHLLQLYLDIVAGWYVNILLLTGRIRSLSRSLPQVGAL